VYRENCQLTCQH